ncbi:MFS transporter [Salininema proteolyticum]|uniref:MFS transporter n=1 Tax=Salininema proteolyticum TaxID=1607685 RepID=A0ABV8TZB6_9ACTN
MTDTASTPSRVDSAAGGPPFSGPRMVVMATLMYGLSAPGQTATISVFLDPMIADLGVSRTVISTAYLVGTLAGAIALPTIGKLVDRFGVRVSTAWIGAALALALGGLSMAVEVFGLTAGFIGIRAMGQGAMVLAASALLSRWYDKKRGFMLGIQAALGAGLISLSPIGLERLIEHFGDWRAAMAVEAAVVALVAVPMALLWIRNRPADVGQYVDGDPALAHESKAESGATRRQAVRTPFYWVLVGAVGMAGFFGTSIGFHQIALLGEHGLSTTEAAANFLPQTIAGTAATLLTGYLVDRMGPRVLLAVSMFLLAAGLAMATAAAPGWNAIAFGLVFGAGANTAKAIEAGMTPRYFGTANIGAIRGVMSAVMIAGTSVAPLLYSVFHDWTGSFTEVLWISAALPLVVLVASLVVPLPEPFGAAAGDAVSQREQDEGAERDTV